MPGRQAPPWRTSHPRRPSSLQQRGDTHADTRGRPQRCPGPTGGPGRRAGSARSRRLWCCAGTDRPAGQLRRGHTRWRARCTCTWRQNRRRTGPRDTRGGRDPGTRGVPWGCLSCRVSPNSTPATSLGLGLPHPAMKRLRPSWGLPGTREEPSHILETLRAALGCVPAAPAGSGAWQLGQEPRGAVGTAWRPQQSLTPCGHCPRPQQPAPAQSIARCQPQPAGGPLLSHITDEQTEAQALKVRDAKWQSSSPRGPI